MPIAAVPKYLGNDFTQASPGLRFGMYLKLWGVNNRTHDNFWTTHDINYRITGNPPQERAFNDDNKVNALKEALKLGRNDVTIMQALLTRQRESFKAATSTESGVQLNAQSTAPFTTGLGNEHPLENGFAFLNPYGIPYLPGSGVKGVLRQAARELAEGKWGDTQGWHEERCYPLMETRDQSRKPVLDDHKNPIMLTMLDVLFGYESKDGETTHVRGVLSFWDVIPQIKGNSLSVEIMTPHQGHYYQQKTERNTGNSSNPHESGQPIPISFLTVPPGSGFTFNILCDTDHLNRLAPELAQNEAWKTLLTAAFAHAFQWLGFGAKTAVGYGAMKTTAPNQAAQAAVAPDRQAEPQEAAQGERWENAQVNFNQGNGTLTVRKNGKTATALNATGLLESLSQTIQQQIKRGQFVKINAYVSNNVLIRVED
jgi:CRISPR-associated protein Cmr6